jgi:superfamily I DNA/RNA helicase
MLIGEIVTVTLDYVRNNPLRAERQRFDHAIVDEYQDLNCAEQVLIDLLAEQGTLTVIGDEDQSIYSFKHAHPEGIVTFADGHPGTHDETLDSCRRCPTAVVALANHLILDLGLPVVSGYVVQQEIAAQAHTRNIPIVVVTASSVEPERLQVACMLRKPVSPEQLVQTVKNCLRSGAPGIGS